MFFLHDDMIQLILNFVWGDDYVKPRELESDLLFYITWRKNVPPLFFSASLLDRHLWLHVPSPMRRYTAYYPSKNLQLHPTNVWSETLVILGTMLCRENIRNCKTYKRCALRWINECTSCLSLEYWEILKTKLLIKLRSQHFRSRAHQPFVLACLQEISCELLA